MARLLWFVPSFPDQSRLGDTTTVVPPSLEHLTRVAQTGERVGFEGMLVPTGEGCLDAWVVAATLAQLTERIRFLVAFRPGFVNPPVAARMASTLDRMSGGRLDLDVVTDGDVGVDHDARYRRTGELLDVVLRSWHERGWSHGGELFSVRGGGIQQRPTQKPNPPIWLGGSSDAAMRTAAKYADVHLMWGEPVERMAARAAAAKALAAEQGRSITVGTRFQVVCRATDADAAAAAEEIVGSIDPSYGEKLRSHSDRTDSEGQRRQNELWQQSGGDWLNSYLWNGFARARMGASVALVGSGPTIKAALDEYVAAGIDTFILSGYRHDEEAERGGELLLPLV